MLSMPHRNDERRLPRKKLIEIRGLLDEAVGAPNKTEIGAKRKPSTSCATGPRPHLLHMARLRRACAAGPPARADDADAL